MPDPGWALTGLWGTLMMLLGKHQGAEANSPELGVRKYSFQHLIHLFFFFFFFQNLSPDPSCPREAPGNQTERLTLKKNGFPILNTIFTTMGSVRKVLVLVKRNVTRPGFQLTSRPEKTKK